MPVDHATASGTIMTAIARRAAGGYPAQVWSYDFVEGRTHDGRKHRILSIIDEVSRECLALPVARKLMSDDVLAALAELFFTRGRGTRGIPRPTPDRLRTAISLAQQCDLI